MATSRSCCDLHFKCVDCPIITGPDCVCPNNLLPGQLWYNPCTCTFYFDNPNCPETGSECCEYEALNHKAGAGILYSGDCESGSYISVHIDRDAGFEFTEEGALTINCERLIEHCDLLHWNDPNLCSRLVDHCNLWHAGNCAEMIEHCDLMYWSDPQLCEKLQAACDFHPNITSCPGSINVTNLPNGEINLCIDTQTYYRNAGGSSGAGMCIGVEPSSFSEGRCIFQSRNAAFIAGNGSVSGGGALAGYFTETFTNPWLQPAVIDVTMVVQPNIIAAGSGARPLTSADYLPNKKMTYIHAITEQLNVSPPAFGLHDSPVPENWCYTQMDTTSQFHRLSNTPVGSGDWTQPKTSQATNSARFVKILNPGETLTLYYQWWAVMNQSQNAGVHEWIMHGGMSTASLLHKHAAPF